MGIRFQICIMEKSPCSVLRQRNQEQKTVLLTEVQSIANPSSEIPCQWGGLTTKIIWLLAAIAKWADRDVFLSHDILKIQHQEHSIDRPHVAHYPCNDDGILKRCNNHQHIINQSIRIIKNDEKTLSFLKYGYRHLARNHHNQ